MPDKPVQTVYPLAGKTKRRERDDILKWIEQDWQYAFDGRQPREVEWADYWKIYLSAERRERIAGRSNSVGPHGGLTIRALRPQIKRNILSVRPFVRAVSRKPELRDFDPLLENQMDYWIEAGRLKHVLLTDMLNEALIMGLAWGFVEHSIETRPTMFYDVDPLTGEPIDEETTEVTYMGPRIIYVPIEEGFPDPIARSRAEMRFWIHRFFKSKVELREDPRYDPEAVDEIGHRGAHGRNHSIPLDSIFTEQRRRVLGVTQSDWNAKLEEMRGRGDEPVEVMQLVSGGQLFSVANRSIIIREQPLDHHLPVLSMVPDPIPGEVYGKSVFHDSRSPMTQRDFVANNVYDNLARLVHGMYKGIPGQYDPKTLRARPGGVVKVTNMNGLEPLQQQDIVNGAWNLLTHLDRDIERGTGVAEILSTIGAGGGTVYPETARVGLQKQENALMFVGEMTHQIEEGCIKPAVEIIADIESRHMSTEDFIATSGEMGAKWRDVSIDTLLREVDWRVVGSTYAASKRNQAESMAAGMPWIVQVGTLLPQAVDIAEGLRTFLETIDAPNVEKIVPGEPKDMGPEAEHRVMAQGIPVKPEPDEDLVLHLNVHMRELERVLGAGEGGEEGESPAMDAPGNPNFETADPIYIERLMEHVQATQSMARKLQEARQNIAQAEVAQQLATQGGGGGTVRPGPGEAGAAEEGEEGAPGAVQVRGGSAAPVASSAADVSL